MQIVKCATKLEYEEYNIIYAFYYGVRAIGHAADLIDLTRNTRNS